jgi:hypothetical protein
MTIKTKAGDEFVRHAEPVDVFKDKAHGTVEWFVQFQLDRQTLYVGLRDRSALEGLRAMIDKAIVRRGND